MKSENLKIDSLTIEQMLELQQQLSAAIPELQRARIEELRKSIRAQIEAAGLTLSGVLGPMLHRSGKRKPARVKYQLGELTWTGKGKQPGWVVDALAGGKTLEDLAA